MVFTTIGPARGMKLKEKPKGPSSLMSQKRQEASQKAKDTSRKFSLKARFEALVSNGTPPTNAAIQVGLRLPPAQVFSTNEILQFIDKDKYIGPQKRR